MPSQDELAQQLLSDPKVQQAMAAAGQNAMNDPKGQAAMQEAAKESGSALAKQLQDQGPQMAKEAMDKAMKMAGDPEVQAKAKEYASKAGALAAQYGAMGADMFMSKLEQGNVGVRVLAFFISLASIANAVQTVINPVSLLGPITYVISVYQLIFATSSALFELPPEYLEKVKFLEEYQHMIAQKCAFMSDVQGRGMFYIFQGTLWFGFASMDILDLAVAALLVFIGIVHVAMHYGVGPSTIAAKMREGG